MKQYCAYHNTWYRYNWQFKAHMKLCKRFTDEGVHNLLYKTSAKV